MSNLVSGKVVRQDNGFGIENLTVVLYDVDLRRAASGAVATPSADTSAAGEASLEQGRSDEEDPLLRFEAPPGDRLGSVLTTPEGKFEIEFSDEAFRRGKSDQDEIRPDLMLVILGPDQSRKEQGRVVGKPVRDRVVYTSLYPAWNAGRRESVFVEIGEEFFDAAGLRNAEAEISETSRHDLFQDEQVVLKRQIDLQDARTKLLSPSLKATKERYSLAKAVSNRIHSDLKPGASAKNLIPASLPMKERNALIGAAQQDAIANGLNRMAPAERIAIPLYIDPVRSAPLLSDIELSSQPQTVTIDTVCGLLNLAANGQSLVRSRSVLNGLAAGETSSDTEAQEINVRPGAGDASDEAPPMSPTEHIKKLVERQVADIGLVSEDPSLSASTLDRLATDLNAATFAKGPADTKSFKDFHTLQMAFEDVWSESMSNVPRGLTEVLFDLTVKVNESFGETPPIDPIIIEELETLDELLDVGDQLDRLQHEMSQTVGATPSRDLRFLVPTIQDVWRDIDAPDQLEIEILATARYYPSHYLNVEEFSGSAIELFVVSGKPIDAIEVHGFTEPRNRLRWYNSHPEGRTAIRAAIAARQTELNQFIQNLGLAEIRDDASGAPRQVLGSRLRRLMNELAEAVNETYKFEHFLPDSVNYGIVTTFRQTIEPGEYQVGGMEKSVPLAPGETRTITMKETRSTSRQRQETEKNERSRNLQTNESSRLQDEVLNRAEHKTGFANTSAGNFSLLKFANFSNSTSFRVDQALYSQETRSQMREAARNSVQEIRSERSFEVKFSEEFRQERTETVTLSNPNNEVAVTYLLYELERQYKISEKIQALTPVIMVAQELPSPDEITEAWLLRHDWVLKRVLLDESYRKPLHMLRDDFVADEVSISVKRQNWQTQIAVVTALEGSASSLLSEKRKLQSELITAEYNEDVADARRSSGGFLHRIAKAITPFSPTDFLSGSGNVEARAEMAKSLFEVAETQYAEAADKLANAREALNVAARIYSEAVESLTQRRTMIDALRVHVKDNILHYMQAIWSLEQDDQRYFRLYKKTAFFPQGTRTEVTVRSATSEDVDSVFLPGLPQPNVVIEGLSPPEYVGGRDEFKRPLHEIADLDTPLGFKGNYMLFPLKECCVITDYMMAQFVDGYFGVRDPDPLAEFSNSELMQYRRRLEAEAGRLEETGASTIADQKRQHAELVKAIVSRRLDSSHRDEDEIVLPTGQLYMEAITGSKTLLEPFKLAHRGYDALRAREELRRAGLENLRYAQRLVDDIPRLDDPEVDKNIRFEGGGTPDVEIE